MATVTKWVGVSVAMQSALATAITVGAGGITKANPGVMTYTGTDPTNGDYIYFASVSGMIELNGKVVRVANVNAGANTLELEGVDTTLYTTMVSASAQVVTFGTSITTALTSSGSGGDFGFQDTTTIHDFIRTQVPDLANPIAYSMDHLWDSADAGQIAMKAASEAQAIRAFKFTFGTGGKIMAFAGYVGFAGVPGGEAPGIAKSPAVITAFGRPTFYAS